MMSQRHVRWISWPQRMRRFSVLTALASEPPGKGREDPGPSTHILEEWNHSERERERQIIESQLTVIILNKESSDWRNKHWTQHSEEYLCNISGSQIWWHEGCSGSHELEKERKVASWCHHQHQDAQSGVMRTARCANFLFCNWISPFTSRGCRNPVSYLLLLALR